MWCLGVSARPWVGPVVWGIAFAGSAGRWVAAAWACCGPGAVPAGGEWRCVVGVYRFHGGGGAICSGVGWARGRMPAGSGCRGRTVGGYSAASPWCVPWWPLVGWLKGVFGVYRIHGGTIVCWGAAAVGAASCGGGACVGVHRVFGGGVSCVVLGGSSWWSVVVVPGGWSWALRFLGGCGTCGVGLAGGGGGARVWACVFALCSPRGPFLCLSLTPLFSLACLAFFFLGGGVAGVLCVDVGVDVGAGPGGADGGWLAAVVAWRLRGWLRLLVSVRVAWLGVGVRVGVFVAWADGVVGSVGVVGLCGCRVCVRRRRSGLGWGTVGDAMGGGDAGDAYGGVLWASKRVCVVDVGASGDAPGGDGVGDVVGVIGDGAGAGGACGSGGRCKWCSGWWRDWWCRR